jgi:signal-transduction protein with cAMP-binding, CBS, and nucleotidyltransferase domain
MANTVKDWMSSPATIVQPELLVSQALTLMRRRTIHSLVVDLSESEPAYGILTTTDIRDKIAAAERDPAALTVREIMTTPVTCARPDWSLRQASKVMQELGIHHLPVEDERGAIIGLLSATDVFIAVEESGWSEPS